MPNNSNGYISIGGTTFAVQSLKVSLESLAAEDSGRTDDGVMHINWVLRRIRKVQIQLPPCESAEVAALLDLVQGKEYSLTYFDPLTGGQNTITAYTSNSSADCYSGILYNGLWQGVSFNAIEVGGEG